MSGEKSEEPTDKRLRDARKKGNVPKSAEFTSTAVAVTAFSVLVLTATMVAGHLAGFMRDALDAAIAPQLDYGLLTGLLYQGVFVIGLAIGPILAASFIVSAFVSYVQIGPVFTVKPLTPDAKKLNMFEGAKNMFSKAKAVELVKNVGKLGLMIAIGQAVFGDQLAVLIRTPRLRLVDAMAVFADSAMALAQYLVGGLIVFAILDLLWVRHKYTKDLMMSKQEVKEEHKQSEGDPMVKSQRRQLHRELLREGNVANVKNADAVVANPTHVAVALRYREEEMNAPTVIARGRGPLAREMRRLARRYRVPIVRDIPLARALVDVDLEDEIPEEFYEPVAEVLRYVYSLREDDAT